MKSGLPLLAIATALLLLTGCSTSEPTPTPTTASSPAPTTSETVPVEAEAELPYGLREPATGLDGTGVPEGYVAFEQTKQEAGDFLRITLDPSNPILQDTTAFDQASLEQFGFTEEDGLAAQQAALAFSVQELFSSDVLDSPSADLNAWFADHASLYFSDSFKEDLASQPDPTSVLAAITGAGYFPQPVIRDATAPIMYPNLQVNNVQGYMPEGGTEPRISVEIAFTNTLSATREATVAAYERNLSEPATPLLEQIGDADLVNLISAGTHTYVYDPASKQFTYMAVDYTVYESTSGLSITE